MFITTYKTFFVSSMKFSGFMIQGTSPGNQILMLTDVRRREIWIKDRSLDRFSIERR